MFFTIGFFGGREWGICGVRRRNFLVIQCSVFIPLCVSVIHTLSYSWLKLSDCNFSWTSWGQHSVYSIILGYYGRLYKILVNYVWHVVGTGKWKLLFLCYLCKINSLLRSYTLYLNSFWNYSSPNHIIQPFVLHEGST